MLMRRDDVGDDGGGGGERSAERGGGQGAGRVVGFNSRTQRHGVQRLTRMRMFSCMAWQEEGVAFGAHRRLKRTERNEIGSDPNRLLLLLSKRPLLLPTLRNERLIRT